MIRLNLLKASILTLIGVCSFFFKLSADVKSTTGNLLFDVNSDGRSEMRLSGDKLGFGQTSPSYHLEIQGNAIITRSLGIGEGAISSNLHIRGTFGSEMETVANDGFLSGNSHQYLLDSSSDNLLLYLPLASDHEGRIMKLKKSVPQTM